MKRKVMITLQPITNPQKLEEYYRFRYSIYSESRNRIFLKGEEGIDRDGHDARAMHFGGYVDDELMACDRIIPVKRVEDVYLLEDMRDEHARNAIINLVSSKHAQGHRVAESSRTCLASQHRSISNAKQLVLAVAACAHRAGYDEGLFGCDRSQAAFYVRLGFEVLGVLEPSPLKELRSPSVS